MSLLSIDNLNTHFFTKAGVVKSVDGVSLSLDRGEILGIVGESGSGKSVTGFSIMGLVDPPGRIVEGSIRFDGHDLVGLADGQMRDLRGRRIAMIFQDPMMTLNPVLRVDTQMIEALRAHGKWTDDAARQRCRDVLGQVGIPSPEERLRSYPHQFSGGMRQRVAIAIALLHQPDLIIADEPTTALDVTIQAQILFEIQKLVAENNTAMIWVTHDLAVVAGLADRVAVMYAGRIVEMGTTDQVVNRPLHPYTVGLIGSAPSRNARGTRLTQIKGMAPLPLNLPSGCAFQPRCDRATQACATAPEATLAHGGHLVRCHHPLERAMAPGATP
ncbi:MAG: ABC transporter ATP-binding protein [Pseudomonadota bacterium]